MGTTGGCEDESVSDVVVIGTGPGGMAATAAAACEGATVTAVDTETRIGGNSINSAGYLTFVDSAMQRACGIEDSEEAFVGDAMRTASRAGEEYGILCDEELVRLFARESGETFRRLSADGVRFSRCIRRPRQHTVDRMLAVEDPSTFAMAFRKYFDLPNVATRFSTVAERLIIAEGDVVGVRARQRTGSALTGDERYGEPVDLYARRGVVLATGGYQANPLLRQRYQPSFLARAPYLGLDSCRGGGHLMGGAIGGDLINMTHVPPLVMVNSALVEDAIAVNEAGMRFHDEAGPGEERVASLMAQPHRNGWYVIDSVTARAKRHLIDQMPERPTAAPSLAQLARAIGCRPIELQQSVDEWNTLLASGADRDPVFGRVVFPSARRSLVKAPFLAIPMVIGVNFVSGGFVVTTDMQVVDVFGRPIRGLFAVGDCVGGFNPVADLGGMRLAGGFTFGHIAGRSVARAVHDESRYPSMQHQVRAGGIHRSMEIARVAEAVL